MTTEKNTRNYLAEELSEAELAILRSNAPAGLELPDKTTRAEAMRLILVHKVEQGDEEAVVTLKDWEKCCKQMEAEAKQEDKIERNESIYAILRELQDGSSDEVNRLLEQQYEIIDKLSAARQQLSKVILQLTENTTALQQATNRERVSNDRFVNAVCDLIDSFTKEQRENVSE